MVNDRFESGEFFGGLQIRPDESINRRVFAEHYYDHKVTWDKAFAFLKNTDFAHAPLGRVDLGDNLFATVSEYLPKDREGALFEAHQKYIDIQYVVSGNELMDVAPMENVTVTKPYNPEKDVAFGTVTDFSERKANPERFFIFFPGDAHRPNLKDGSDSTAVRKVVVKVPVEKAVK